MLRTRRASGSRVRTEIRGSTGSAAGDPSRSVAARRTSRRRPSGSASAMNPGPRLQLADNSLSVCPNKGWPVSVTVTLETTGSKTAASRSARRSGHGTRRRRPPRSPRNGLRDERRELPKAHRRRAKTRARSPANARDNHRLIVSAARPRKPLASASRRDDHPSAATKDSHPDCRAARIKIVVLHTRPQLRAPGPHAGGAGRP